MLVRWRKSLLALALIFSAEGVHPNAVWASDKAAEGAALINHAIQLTDLTQSGPYHMGMTLTVVDEAVGKLEGTDVVNFSSTEQWRRDLHMTGYDEVAVFLGHNMYRTRNLPFTPPSLRKDIAGSLRNLPEALDYKVVRAFNHKVNDVEARCVLLEHKNGGSVDVTWCFDPHTGLPAEQLYGNGHGRIEFSNYKPLGNKFVPGSVEVIVNGKQTGRALIETVESGITDPDHVFEPPVGSIIREWCDNMERPTATSGALPNIPAGYYGGYELDYELTVDVRGKVTSVTPISPRPAVDRAAIEALQDWRFKPAMCDHTPVPTDVLINVGAMIRR